MDSKKRKISSIGNLSFDDDNNNNNMEKSYRFQVLLPNGLSVTLQWRNPKKESMPLEYFVERVKEKCKVVLSNEGRGDCSNFKPIREVYWNSKELFLEDALGNKIKGDLCYDKFKHNKTHFLKLYDGSVQTESTIENMWDLTPNTDLLTELPDDYTFVSALADLIDNSLQAVWSNAKDERKLIRVEINDGRVCVFDTGPGMDGTPDNSISKWGKLGASAHRSSKKLAVGGKPPYLTPFFGMFGYGGTIASMHLGRHAIVSAKTKQSKKVYWLRLERDALLKRAGSSSASSWKAPGGIRDPKDDEIESSSHGSFVKVEMEPKLKVPDIFQLQCKLKDIYFPYIQCDEIAGGRTTTLVEFQVNGINLAEIDGGEVSVTNLQSCNGPEFIIDLHFSIEEESAAKCHSLKQANARLKCVYFPFTEGKENLERILEKLNDDGFEMKEDFQTYSRICIRRLGRLLPDARWDPLPFMKPKQKRGDKLRILRRCCSRVKCFIDTDAGFNPIPSKTDLALHHPFSKALKELGSIASQKEKEVNVEVIKGGKRLSLSQLEIDYQNWILQMHGKYDDEFDCGEGEAVLLVNAPNKEELGVTSDVVRIHETISRKGRLWTRGQKVKFLKGAGPGCYNNNRYGTIEYFLLEGLQGDAGGEAHVIFRPQEIQEEDGCKLKVDAYGAKLELHSSLSLPIVAIDSGKCTALTDDDWNSQHKKLNLKMPSKIEVLCKTQCKLLNIDGALPTGEIVSAGHIPPKEVAVVLRPSNFSSSSATSDVDQKYIVKDNNDMSMDVTFEAETEDLSKVEHIFSASVMCTSRRGCQGLYIFSLDSIPCLFRKAGVYSFSFSHKKSSCEDVKVSVQVKASAEIKCWELLDDHYLPFIVSAGSCFPEFSVVRYDDFGNCVPFNFVPKIQFVLMSDDVILYTINNVKLEISLDKSHLIIRNIRVKPSNLDQIRPSYKASLVLSQPDKMPLLSIPCQVLPGPPKSVLVHKSKPGDGWLPKQVVEALKFEIFDRHDNHVKEGMEIELAVYGFSFLDQLGVKRKVDDHGFVDLSGLLKIMGGYGKLVSISIHFKEMLLCTEKFVVERRELRMASTVPEVCHAGSKLTNITFEVVDCRGDVDESIHDDDKHGQSHTLRLRAIPPDIDDSLRFAFRKGRCIIPSVRLPKREGEYCIEAIHSQHSELLFKFKVNVSRATYAEYDITSELQESNGHNDELPEPPSENFTLDPISVSPENDLTRKRSEVQEKKAAARQLYKACDSESSLRTVYANKMSDCSVEEFTNLSVLLASKKISGESEHHKKQATDLQTPSKKYDAPSSNGNHLMKSPDGNIISLYSSTLELAEKLIGPEFEKLRDLEKDIDYLGSEISKFEGLIEYNEFRKSKLEDELQGCLSQEDLMVLKIENKADSAAAVYSIVSRDTLSQEQDSKFMVDVVGLVALLGTAPTPQLSRSLAEYLGEEQMLAIVCRSNAAITMPEKYEDMLNSFAASMEKCIKGSHLLISLEDIRPFSGGIREDDPQRSLGLPSPVLPDGTTVRGFLGYAVDMIDIDVKHIHTKTSAGYGLRETLFYRLFGDLQVYETKEDMKQAYGYRCIRAAGAVSLDGGIIRGNGIISLGCRQLDVHFPVVTQEGQLAVSSEAADIEGKKRELVLVEQAIALSREERDGYLQLFHERQAEFLELVEAKKASLLQQYLQTKHMPSQCPGAGLQF